jgi:purine-cytosine permease-like protein
VIAFALVYLGTFVWDAVDSVSAFLALLAVVGTPWIVINVIGFWNRRGWYDPSDLQVFNRGERGGRYWFTHGLNWRALIAWLPASAIGLLFSNTTLYIGPANELAGDVDIGCIVSGVLAGVVYLALIAAFPEDRDVFGERGGAFVGEAAGAPSAITITEEVGR